MDTKSLKELVAAKLDVVEFLDILGWSMYDLIDVLGDEVIEDCSEALEKACG